MDRRPGGPAFFDIGDTLASVTISATGDRLERLTPYPYVSGVLADLRNRGVRLGIISDPGPIPADEVNLALEAAGLWHFLDPQLVRYGRKDTPRLFEQAAGPADGQDRPLFVGEDAGERAQALSAGFLVAPHPRLAWPVLEQHAPLLYVRLTVPHGPAGGDWRAPLRDLPLLPLHVTGGAGATVYAVTTPAAAAQLDDLGFWVDRLGAEDQPLTSELYLLRDDRQAASGFLAVEGNSRTYFEAGPAARGVLASTSDGLLVAVPAGSSVEDYHFSGAQHGHNLKLGQPVPLTELVDDRTGLAEPEVAAVTVTATEQELLDAWIRPDHLSGHVERYAGSRPVGTGGRALSSRHVQHADNAAAVAGLATDLARIDEGRLAVRRHRFPHEGRSLENVEAELPGDGLEGLVLVTAHMDSTAARQAGYRPARDPAPGADDDASGIAGVLTAAAAITALDTALRLPRRTVRFVFFNAEEHGLVGSRAYARDQALLGVPIVAVVQMDMIGYDVRPDRTFELHAGFTPSPAVQARSLALAGMIASLAPQVSPALAAAQICPAAGESDPAESRSDHYSFQLQGYPACLASEDLFAGPGSGAPSAEMNPEYHLPTDTTINAGYAADIARLVTAAAWVAATR